MCSSCSVVAFWSMAPAKLPTTASARKAARGAGSHPLVATEEVPVPLEVAGEAADGLAQADVLGQVVADGGEARPHRHRRRVPPGLLGGVLDRAHGPLGGLVGEEGVQDDVVEGPATELQGLRPEGHEQQRDVLVELAAEVQHRPRARRPLVPEDHLALPEAAQEAGGVLHLGGGDAGDAEGVLHQRDPATEAEHVPAAGQLVHGHGVRGRHHRMAGVVVGGRGGDADLRRHRPGRAGEGGRLLHVVALGDEGRAEAEGLALPCLVEQRRRRRGATGQQVEAQFVEAAVGHGAPRVG